MNIYEIINIHNKEKGILPYRYIGSDTRDRVLIEQYAGSSKLLKRDMAILGRDHFTKNILWQGTKADLEYMGYGKLTELEADYHIGCGVKFDHTYYNIVEANTKFTTQGHAVYKTKGDESTVLLPTDHPLVLSGQVVGRNTGMSASEETKERLKQRAHPSEYMDWSAVIKARKPFKDRNPRNPNAYRGSKSEQHKQNMRKPKSPEHRAKLERNNQRNNKQIIKYNKEGDVLDVFPSIKTAAESIGGGNRRCDISACCRGKQKTAYGFVWKYQV